MAAVEEPDEEYHAGPQTFQSQASGNSRHQAYDERPAMGRGRYTPSEEQMAAVSAARKAPVHQAEDDGVSAPAGWPGDLPAPEQLAGGGLAQRRGGGRA